MQFEYFVQDTDRNVELISCIATSKSCFWLLILVQPDIFYVKSLSRSISENFSYFRKLNWTDNMYLVCSNI